MLTIRLQRVGKRNNPSFRVVVQPKHRAPSGKNKEIVGRYQPNKEPSEVSFDAERVKYWIDKGAQPSKSVWNLLVEEGIIEGDKKNVTHITGKREERMKEEEEARKAAEEEAKAEAESAEETNEDTSENDKEDEESGDEE